MQAFFRDATHPNVRAITALPDVTPMPLARDDLFLHLAQLGIETETVEHAPLFTVEESKRLRGDIPGAHTKNLFLKSKKDELFLLVALESTPIALASLHKEIGCARLSFGKPELLWECLGVRPGAVSPFALINDTKGRVVLLLDAALLGFGRLNFHPLDNTATTGIQREAFLRFTREIAHEPRILRFSETVVESAPHA
jgi:Ala-tRNA(Pro) deacylase